VHETILMAREPERAHEQADNRSIAAALASIPIAGTVVATNDLRYPANNYGRDLMQYQIPALFGHQAFAVPGYDRYPGWEERVLAQRDLASASVSCVTLRRLGEAGVTHLLFHTPVTTPSSLELPLIYSRDHYAVYRLRAPLSCQ
jgi:hypothetical protein